MKAISLIVVVILAAAAIGFFTKPSNVALLDKAKEAARSINAAVPGYGQPLAPESSSTTPTFSEDQILIIDRLLWKEVRYTSGSNIQLLGYGYLGKFHEVVEKKSQ